MCFAPKVAAPVTQPTTPPPAAPVAPVLPEDPAQGRAASGRRALKIDLRSGGSGLKIPQ